jgi:hypothetical protein
MNTAENDFAYRLCPKCRNPQAKFFDGDFEGAVCLRCWVLDWHRTQPLKALRATTPQREEPR